MHFQSSSSLLDNLFSIFSLGREGFSSLSESLLHDLDEDRFNTYCYRNSLDKEMIKEISMAYFTSLEIEITIPRSEDSVTNPPVGFAPCM